MNLSKLTTKKKKNSKTKAKKIKTKKIYQGISAFINKNKGKAKIGFYIIGSLITLLGIIWIATRRPQIPANIKTTIDSLTSINNQLSKHQQQIDSIITTYETKINQINSQMDNIKEKTTIVREYYHEINKQVEKYNPTQIDSFFKARYKY
jgi:ABC-type transporter Mla subunit MlaD